MPPSYRDIETVEPKVVDLTIDHSFPRFSVRMPIYRMESTHEHDYFELLYRIEPRTGAIHYSFSLSKNLLTTLYQSQQALDNLPVMNPDQVPSIKRLGLIECVAAAVNKLKQFHETGAIGPYFAEYRK
jgi:hypothetical protein